MSTFTAGDLTKLEGYIYKLADNTQCGYKLTAYGLDGWELYHYKHRLIRTRSVTCLVNILEPIIAEIEAAK